MRGAFSLVISRVSAILLCATLLCTGARGVALAQAPPGDESPPLHDVYGTVLNVRGEVLRLQLRNGRTLAVDLREARSLHHVVLLTTSRPVHVRGIPSPAGFHAVAVLKSHAGPEFWPPDR